MTLADLPDPTRPAPGDRSLIYRIWTSRVLVVGAVLVQGKAILDPPSDIADHPWSWLAYACVMLAATILAGALWGGWKVIPLAMGHGRRGSPRWAWVWIGVFSLWILGGAMQVGWV